MTDQDDLTGTDHLVGASDNSLRDYDPTEQPSQDPADVPVDHSEELA